MKNWRLFFIITWLCIISCTDKLASKLAPEVVEKGWKSIDLDVFKISVPQNWKYIKEQGDDSFIGTIKTPNSSLSFDYSTHGYANSLIPTEEEYLKSEDWMQAAPCIFCKVDVIYTAKWDVQKVKARQMKEKGIKDSSLVKVEAIIEPTKKVHKPTSAQRSKYPKADYIADLSYKDSTIILPIMLPREISAHNITIDTSGTYIIKTIYPKVKSNGITGVYIHRKNSHFTFNLVGKNLSAKDQQDALTAFKTIKFKE